MKRILLAATLLLLVLAGRTFGADGTLQEIQVEPLPFGAPIGSTYINNHALAAATNEQITVPTNARWAFFACNVDVWVRYDGTAAAVPSVDITNGVGQELNPTIRYIRGIARIDMISASAGFCSIAYYKQTTP